MSDYSKKNTCCLYKKAIRKTSNTDIGKLVGLHHHAVSFWIHCYEQGGIDALHRNNYGTNKSELENHSESIMTSFTERPPMNANEAKARIEELTGISRSPTQVRAFMKRHKLRYIKTGHIPAKADLEVQQGWVKTKLEPAIEDAKNGKCQLLFMDAVHLILMPFVCSLWCKVRMFIKAPAGRNRINILGTVNAITKEIFTINNTTFINAETVVAFLKKLREHYLDLPITIVLDNARYQHCQLVEQAAEKIRNYAVIFTTIFAKFKHY